MGNLKNHPFAVEAFFESSLVLTFAVPKEKIRHLIPECLTLDTFNDHWAFIAVAMVDTKNLRPKGFPLFLGNDFFLTGLPDLRPVYQCSRQAFAGIIYSAFRNR